jgi:hypothetical protein
MQKQNDPPAAIPSNQTATSGTNNLLEDSSCKISDSGQFIYKLHAAICKHDGGGIVNWYLDGSFFTVNKPVEFAKTILPTFCSGKTFNSFERQIHFYS